MITRLSGRLLACDHGSAELEPVSAAGGPGDAIGSAGPAGSAVVFEALIPAYLAETLAARVGETVTLHTRLHVDSVNQGATLTPRLLGFGSPQERRFFELFTSVKGLGPKRALRAMAEPPSAIASAIAARDTKALARLPEIGKRLAETIVAELVGKVEGFQIAGEPGPAPRAAATGPADTVSADAVAALMSLGQTRAEAERMVEAARGRLEGEPSVDALLAAVFGTQQAL